MCSPAVPLGCQAWVCIYAGGSWDPCLGHWPRACSRPLSVPLYRVSLCICPRQKERPLECQTRARRPPSARGGRRAELCPYACKCPRGGHVHRGATIVAGSSLDLAPEPPVRGQGLSRPRGGYGWGGYRWSRVGFGPGSSTGGSPEEQEQAGGEGTKKEKVREGGQQRRRRRRRKHSGMWRALGSRGAGHQRLHAWD